ncbi:MAG: Asp-tRNA(Asn)/Glu-tRNA(Gln) amidotransferase subunit GatB [Candidatus Magasanikbacteria bacterium CG_4_10_14_0_8_um_filter_32_14]|uniref:Aspartyl/glutamyl-tRNA(Asn/Gln) amidotransferase subunit B n=2 Tax=Candidatus Magasanikiibacteriota TaxID=1752731 RepID=A0A2M7RA99_9BACT|nr:MAG: glutaminyl-tRNA synthase (glutamine-hydrolyzing) subunit B [Candidatus Magasanikbacteria bacterium CG1_02_32_51]PIY93574.1 MAG: Asp-tRNA(Asn)/Glu-tRNA(Gln) amidotransferase subunit GatB [Candidatus Magasanikbacteria bacterium CG_4_10_14_0_8_um_filter_32_14]
MKQFVPIIGMEVHVELKTASKMFCSCTNNPNIETPNKNICEICLAHPGTLPVPNKKAIEWTVLVGKALNCHILEFSKFDRKHYFYPDLPKGYQISQYQEPIAEHGFIELDFANENPIRNTAKIGITRAHLEEDTAKLNHGEGGSTLVDFNRAGVPLVEIVTDPDFKSALEAKVYCQELRNIVRYLGVSDADMEKGQMRCEANISVQEVGSFEIVDGVVKPLNGTKLNNKVELKNLNSFKAVERGIDFEIKRQTAMIENGETWVQQTRGWDDNKQETVMQRTKENASDYRYFPDPDIPPFHPLQIAGNISLPELPAQKRIRFHKEFFLSFSDAKILSDDKELANFTEEVMSELSGWLDSMPESEDIAENVPQKISRLAGGWITSKLLGIIKEKGMSILDVKFSAENFAELVALIYNNKVNTTNAYKILLIMIGLDIDKDPTHILEEKGWGQVSDSNKIEIFVEEVIKNYPDQVAQVKAGKDTVIKFLIGMVMKASEGSADPTVVEKVLRDKLI